MRSGGRLRDQEAILSQTRNVELDCAFNQTLDLGHRSSHHPDARKVRHVSPDRRGASFDNH